MVIGTARKAGVLYLLSAIAAGVPIIYVPGSLIVDGDPAATSSHILAAESVFRVCIAGELLGALLLVLLVRTLERLLGAAHRRQASLMVILAVLSVPITFVGVLIELGALALFHGTDFPAVFDAAHRNALGLWLLDLHGDGVSLANIFWGLWLVPFGLLLLQSGALPKLLGWLLLINGAALVGVSLTALLMPGFLDVVSRYAVLPELGELWTMGWLLIMGARPIPEAV